MWGQIIRATFLWFISCVKELSSKPDTLEQSTSQAGLLSDAKFCGQGMSGWPQVPCCPGLVTTGRVRDKGGTDAQGSSAHLLVSEGPAEGTPRALNALPRALPLSPGSERVFTQRMSREPGLWEGAFMS